MSISNSYPTQNPVLNLNFATGSDQFLDSRISFSRADSTPSNVHYWSNEKHTSSENLVTQSDGSDWIISSADYTKTASQNGPDGSTNATKYTEKANGSTDYEIRSNSFTPIANKEITYSVWLKQTSGSRNYQLVRVGNIGANKAFVTFNLTNGTVDQTGGTLGVSASVNAGPTGWYQCVMRFTPTTSTALSFYIYAAAASGGEFPQVTGDTGNSLTMFGAQASTTGETVVNETSGQIHREFAPTLKSVANAGDPRFEYDPITNNAEGLLIEAQATNYVLYSEVNTGYNSYRLTASSSACVGPTGALAQVFTETTEDGSHYETNTLSTSLNYSTTYTVSVYAKKVASGTTDSRLKLRINGMGGQAYAGFNLVNGTVTQQAGSAIDSASISSVGNGWYRISMTWTNEAADRANGVLLSFNNNTTSSLASYVGDGFTSYALAGLMVEEGSAPSSLISTSGASATRAADSCSVAVSGFAGFADTEGAVVVEANVNSLDSGNAAAVSLENAAGTEYIKIGYEIGGAADQSVRTYVRSNSVDQAWIDAGSVSTTGSYKAAVRYEKNNVGISLNGATTVTDTVATMPIGMTTIYIGSSSTGNSLNANLRRIAYYSEPLSDTNLTALSS